MAETSGKTLNKNIVVGIFLIAFAVFYLAASAFIKTALQNGLGGSKFMPRVIGICLIADGAVILASGIREAGKEKTAGGGKEQEPGRKSSYLSVVLTFAAFLVYSLILQPAGFLLSTALYLFFMIMLLCPREKRDWRKTAVLSVVFDLAIYLLFTKAFSLALPGGLLQL